MNRWLVGAAAVVVVLAIVWALLVPGADWLARHDVGPAHASLLPAARDAARGRLLTLGAGLLAAGALLFTARNFTLSREGQVTDRYTKAIEQLGSDKLEVRIGGIYALERVARDSAKDHPTVMGVLTAFIREHSREQWPLSDAGSPEQERSIRPDVQAAVTVAGRRDAKRDVLPIDLTGANLPSATLTGAHLGGATLTGADLTGARIRGATLTGADLTGARSGARPSPARISPAHTSSARISPARPSTARISPARASAAPASSARTSAVRTSSARTSPARTSPARTSPARTSPTRISAVLALPTHTSPARTSPARTSTTEASAVLSSVSRTLPARTSPASGGRKECKFRKAGRQTAIQAG